MRIVKREAIRIALAQATHRLNENRRPEQSCRRTVGSEKLFQGGDSAIIDHNGKLYLLRCLPSGRLILTAWDARQDDPSPRHSLR